MQMLLLHKVTKPNIKLILLTPKCGRFNVSYILWHNPHSIALLRHAPQVKVLYCN